MDYYQGAAYRNDRARDQQRAFKPGFVAPGIPVEVAPATPPPGPPPGVVPGAAAASGAAAGAGLPVLATVGSVLAGLGLGLLTKAEIDRFNARAKLPFYDPNQRFRAGRGVKVHYDQAKWAGKLPDYTWEDWLRDQEFKRLTASTIDAWENSAEAEAWIWRTTLNQLVGPDGWFHPAWIWNPCTTQPGGCAQGLYYYRGIINALVPGTPWEIYCASDCNAGGSPNFADAQPGPYPAVTEFAPSIPNQINAFKVKTSDATKLAGYGALVRDFTVPGNSYALDLWEQDASTQAVPLGDALDYDVGLDTPGWGQAVAPRGTQPSYREQLDPWQRARHARPMVVPFSLSHPFTRVIPGPGSGPVTVPDQVIDPGSETEPGGVVVVPPTLPPDFPQPTEDKEQKPWPARLAHMGFVAINVGTETMDFLEAMHKGLPKKYRTKGKVAPWVILEDIWDNWEHFRSTKALEAFVNNQIEDAIYGRYFGISAKAQRRVGTAGLARAVRDPREPVKLPIPEVHFTDGRYEITIGEMVVSQGDAHSVTHFDQEVF